MVTSRAAWLWRLMGWGLRQDIQGRLPWYNDDWREGFRQKLRIFAPATYIFCASAIPALAFGEQMANETGGILSGAQVLVATALAGVVQATLGGQPLLIVGVAEPIVLMYKYMFDFADVQDGLGSRLFLAWAAWVCVFAAAFILVLALLNTCNYIDKFTRFAGELFGMLIAVLFMQQAIKGMRQEFQPPHGQDSSGGRSNLVNGLWGLFLSWGFLLSSLAVRTARSWRFFGTRVRGLLADYGVPLLIVAWSGLAYAVQQPGVPRRLLIPNTWDANWGWDVAKDMGKVGGGHIAAALVPAAIIALLFYFDHNVSSQLAQQREFNLKKPSAYHWDFFLLGLLTLLCGLLGLPPVNGVLPQSPTHSKALSSIQRRNKSPPSKPSSGLELASAPGGTAGTDQAECTANGELAAGQERELMPSSSSSGRAPANPGLHVSPSQQVLVPGRAREEQGVTAGTAAQMEEVVPLQVSEQRVSGLLQSLGVAACLGATPAIKAIPSAVLWGYFAFMSIESLPGSQFWDRILLLGTDPKRRHLVLERGHAPYLETVPFKVITAFTVLQLAYTGAVYGLTWAGIAGCLFPVPIMLLVPIRQYLMPRIFRREHLRELDAMEEELAPPLNHQQALQEAAETGMGPPVPSEADLMGMLDQEMSHLRVVHHLGRASLARRRASIEIAGASGGNDVAA